MGRCPTPPQGTASLAPSFGYRCVHFQTVFPMEQPAYSNLPQIKIAALQTSGTIAIHQSTGWRCLPPAGCCASGENKKKPTRKLAFHVGLFHYFHYARGLCCVVWSMRSRTPGRYADDRSHPPASRGRPFVRSCIHIAGKGDVSSGAGFRGCVSLCPGSLHSNVT